MRLFQRHIPGFRESAFIVILCNAIALVSGLLFGFHPVTLKLLAILNVLWLIGYAYHLHRSRGKKLKDPLTDQCQWR